MATVAMDSVANSTIDSRLQRENQLLTAKKDGCRFLSICRLGRSKNRTKTNLISTNLMVKKKGAVTQKVNLNFSIDCSAPVEDSVFGIANIEKFLRDRIKVEGKKDNLGTAITLSRDATRVFVKSEIPFSKRYLKYLIKKYLKKLQLRDYLHVISTGKPSYEIKYFNIHNEEENEEEA